MVEESKPGNLRHGNKSMYAGNHTHALTVGMEVPVFDDRKATMENRHAGNSDSKYANLMQDGVAAMGKGTSGLQTH